MNRLCAAPLAAAALALSGCATTQVAERPAPAPAGGEGPAALEERPRAAPREQPDGRPGRDGQPAAVPQPAASPGPRSGTATLADACRVAGVPLGAPEQIAPAFRSAAYRAVEGSMVEAVYTDGAGGEIRVRKAFGSLDISGDYADYPDTRLVHSAGIFALLRGGADGCSVAAWVSGDYTFAILASPALPEEDMLALVQSVY